MVYGARKVRYEDRPVPVIEDPHDVLVRVSYVGVCGSDVHFWAHGGLGRSVDENNPVVMGHEAAGIVHTVGPAVSTLKPGDRVAVEPGCPCRRCKHCKGGRYNICPQMKFAADPPTHGNLCRFYKVPEDFAYKLPDDLSLKEGVLLEPLAVAVHALRLAKVRPGVTVLVQGSGTIGLLVAATAEAFGATSLFLSDINEDKLKFARDYVKCFTFVPDTKASPEEDAARFKKESGLESGVDIVLECTGVSSSTQAGLHAAAAGATFVQVGMGKADQTLPLMVMSEKEIVLKMSFRYGAGDWETAVELLRSRRVSVKELISNTVPFEKAEEAWEMTLRGEGIKNFIKVWTMNEAG